MSNDVLEQWLAENAMSVRFQLDRMTKHGVSWEWVDEAKGTVKFTMTDPKFALAHFLDGQVYNIQSWTPVKKSILDRMMEPVVLTEKQVKKVDKVMPKTLPAYEEQKDVS